VYSVNFFSEGKVTKFDKVVKREICQITTKGTRVFSVIDGDASTAENSYLFALTEKVCLFLFEHLEEVVNRVLQKCAVRFEGYFFWYDILKKLFTVEYNVFFVLEYFSRNVNCIFIILLFQISCLVGVLRTITELDIFIHFKKTS
jgi:hypothetical protein